MAGHRRLRGSLARRRPRPEIRRVRGRADTPGGGRHVREHGPRQPARHPPSGTRPLRARRGHHRKMEYLLSNRQVEAGTRFEAIAELFDPWTFRHLDDLGVTSGWRVWEVGAGAPPVPSWLAERVGETG